jgi:hypothetical protein
MAKKTDNNQELRSLWLSTGLSQPEALALMNVNQSRPLALSTFKAYMSPLDVARRRACPDEILKHAKKSLSKVKG